MYNIIFIEHSVYRVWRWHHFARPSLEQTTRHPAAAWPLVLRVAPSLFQSHGHLERWEPEIIGTKYRLYCRPLSVTDCIASITRGLDGQESVVGQEELMSKCASMDAHLLMIGFNDSQMRIKMHYNASVSWVPIPHWIWPFLRSSQRQIKERSWLCYN